MFLAWKTWSNMTHALHPPSQVITEIINNPHLLFETQTSTIPCPEGWTSSYRLSKKVLYHTQRTCTLSQNCSPCFWSEKVWILLLHQHVTTKTRREQNTWLLRGQPECANSWLMLNQSSNLPQIQNWSGGHCMLRQFNTSGPLSNVQSPPDKSIRPATQSSHRPCSRF